MKCALDDFAAHVESPCLIKVDVDGGEGLVIKGAAGLLRQQGVSWIVETHSAELEAECRMRLDRAGYRIAVVANAWWRRVLPEQRPIAHNRWLVATNRRG